jgi:excisionase family DNA binding protein
LHPDNETLSTAQAPPAAPGRAKAAFRRSSKFGVLVMEKTMPASDQRRSGSGLPKLYAIKTVADTFEVSTRTVRRWISRGDLIVHRVNGVIRIAETDFRAFLALHRET